MVLTISMLFSVCAFASENVEAITVSTENETSIETDLNSIDLSKPFTQTSHFTNSEGEIATVELSYEPAISPIVFDNPDTATVGTWTCSYDTGVLSMSYKFDLSKSGSQWKMSNARDHAYWGLFTTFSNSNLKISRAISTSDFPAEINASVDAVLFDNNWVQIWSGTWIMYTTVTSDGVLTTYHN